MTDGYFVILEAIYLKHIVRTTKVFVTQEEIEKIDSMERLTIASKNKLLKDKNWSELVVKISHFKFKK